MQYVLYVVIDVLYSVLRPLVLPTYIHSKSPSRPPVARSNKKLRYGVLKVQSYGYSKKNHRTIDEP